MISSPKFRIRVYGSPGNYLYLLRDLVTGTVKDEADCREFERRVARMMGVEHACCMPQARVGIYLSLVRFIEPGDEVILSPYTIFDVVNMVVAAGGTPVFADIDKHSGNIDADEVEKLINERTGAVLVTHLHGLACDIQRIAAVCRKHSVPLIEDAAQGLGATVDGQSLGTFGDVGIYSFGMAKNVNTFYGGMCVTRDEALAKSFHKALETYPPMEMLPLLSRALFCLLGEVLTWQPVFGAFTYWVIRHGWLNDIKSINRVFEGERDPVLRKTLPKSYLRRLRPAQARMALRQIDQIQTHFQSRLELARLYSQGLDGIPGVGLPPFREDGSHVYLHFPIQIKNRYELLRFLFQEGRDVMKQHIGSVNEMACFKDFHRNCPVARDLADRVIFLPCYPSYGETQVKKNISAIRKYFSIKSSGTPG